jgi:hypothetical protein
MTYRLLPAAALMAGLALLTARAEVDKGAVELFNGKDLSGWSVVVNEKGKLKEGDPWSVKDKVIVCKGDPWGYLITDKDYGDYKLELEWRWADTARTSTVRRNSGVLLHCKPGGKPWPNCFEAQLLAGSAGDFWVMGAKVEGEEKLKDPKRDDHWFRRKTDKPVEKPLGEWNKYEITCKGDTVELLINGQKVNSGKNAERSKGRIALQSEGAEIHFRNIRLTPLK